MMKEKDPIDVLAGLALPPRGPKGSRQNLLRAYMVFEALYGDSEDPFIQFILKQFREDILESWLR